MNERFVSRLIVLDASSRMLLFNVDDREIFVDPERPHDRPFWITPGGGVEDGETHEAAAVRELREETGIVAPLGPCVATQDVVLLNRGIPTRCVERFFLVRPDRPQVDLGGLLDYEQTLLLGFDWWQAEEMGRSGELFMPPGLVALARTLASGDVPPQPMILGRT